MKNVTFNRTRWLTIAFCTIITLFTINIRSAWGYTITFATASNDNPGTAYSTSTACSTVVSDGADHLSGNLVTATRAYGPGTYGLKLGTSSDDGTIKMNLASNVTPSSIVVNCRRFNSGTAATISVNGSATQPVITDAANITFNITSSTSYIEIVASKYIWVTSITINKNTGATSVDQIAANGFGGYTTNNYGASGTDYSGVANTNNATGVTYALQVFNGSSGVVRGNKSGASNFSARNTSTKTGYFISKVQLTISSGGTIDGSTSGRSVVYFGSSAFSNPNTNAPTGYATVASPASSGQSTLTWYNGDESVSYFILYDLKTANSPVGSLQITWTPKMYNVEWIVNEETWSSGVVAGNTNVTYGSKVSALPTAPSAPSSCSTKVFVGWTNEEIDGEADDAPSVLFTTAEGAPTVEDDVTYYAVFATSSGGGVTELFSWEGSSTNDYTTLTGLTNVEGSIDGYATTNAPYRVKFDSNNEYITIGSLSAAPTSLAISIKKIGGTGNSTFTIQEATAADKTFTNVESFTPTGSTQYDVFNFSTSSSFKSTTRAIKILFTKATGGNTGLGSILIQGGGISYSAYATSCTSTYTLVMLI